MIILVSFLVAVLSVPLFGGRLSRLSELQVRSGHLVLTSFVIQTLVITMVHDKVPGWVAEGAHLYSYVLALAFVVANRRIRGLTLLAVGAAANALVIGVNGGVMPASVWAQRTAGLSMEQGFANSDVVADARLMFLGDVMAIPSGYPFANVFSIGDLLLVIGAGVIMHLACGSALARRFATPATSVLPAVG